MGMKLIIRETTVIPTLMYWRKEVIEEVFGCIPSKRLLVANRRYYRKHIEDGTHIAIVAAIYDIDVGCGSICLSEELPSPDNHSGQCAYLMNIYVRKEYRGRGIGHSIVHWLVEKAHQLDCGKIWLETSDGARSLYTTTGFKELSGIMKYAEIQNSKS